MRRSMGAIWRPPRRLSVAGVRWSTVQANTGAAISERTCASSVRRCSSGCWSLPSNRTCPPSSSSAWREAEPVASACASQYSNSARLAAPPTLMASWSSPRPRSFWNTRPVCSVSVRRPMAKAQRMPTPGSASAFMMRALPSVLPQPVEAMLTMKPPWLAARWRTLAARSAALSCHWKRVLLLRFLRPRWLRSAGRLRASVGSERATSVAWACTPSRCSSSVWLKADAAPGAALLRRVLAYSG